MAAALILDHLLPLAREGLRQSGVEGDDIEHYLGVLEGRVRSGRTGAQWMLQSLEVMGDEGTSHLRQRKLAAAMLERQQGAELVHRWQVIKAYGSEGWRQSNHTVGHLMSTELFTVRPDDLVEMVARVMEWRDVRHVPVEDEEGRLVSIVTVYDFLESAARLSAERPDAGGPSVEATSGTD
jgi:CBS domain-containing protein